MSATHRKPLFLFSSLLSLAIAAYRRLQNERELVVTRTINGPARIVFEAWTKAELLKQSK